MLCHPGTLLGRQYREAAAASGGECSILFENGDSALFENGDYWVKEICPFYIVAENGNNLIFENGDYWLNG